MKTFEIKFYYNTDCRAQEEVEAMDEIEALAIALNRVGERWVTGRGFRVEIQLVG